MGGSWGCNIGVCELEWRYYFVSSIAYKSQHRLELSSLDQDYYHVVERDPDSGRGRKMERLMLYQLTAGSAGIPGLESQD